jgi:hypothetical protein
LLHARISTIPEKSRLAVHRAEGGYRSTGVFGIHEPRSHREGVGHVRGDLDDVDVVVVVVVGGERVMVFLQTLVKGRCYELIQNLTLGRGRRYSRLFRRSDGRYLYQSLGKFAGVRG